jgi:glycosyltransferase involved in cell wall biosynthesis
MAQVAQRPTIEMSDASSRKTILLLAYSVSPMRGSEFAVGWDFITHMAREHDIIVLYGVAGEHMGDFEEMAGVTVPGEFVPVAPGRLARWFNAPNRAGFLGPAFYIAYRFWQRDVLRVARRVIEARAVDVVHYLCPIGYREPGYLGTLDRPYVWGPIGGMNLRPLRLFLELGLKNGLTTALRNAANWLQFRVSPRVRRGMRRPEVLIVNTSENVDLVQRVHGRNPLLMPENAIEQVKPRIIQDIQNGPFAMLWVGRIDTAKALDLLIEALGRVRSTDWTLDIAGDGPRRAQLEERAKALGLDDRVRWHGKMARERVLDLYDQAHVHILTSLAEAHSTVLFEAMSRAVPTVALDHCGMHDSICDACGVRIPLSTVEQIVEHFGRVIEEAIADRTMMVRLSDGAAGCAQQMLWSKRVKRWNSIYDLAIARRTGRAR